MGTQLQRYGMPVGVCSEQWASQHLEIVTTIQKDYLDSGADVLVTPTMGANGFALAKFGLEGKLHELNHVLTENTRKTAQGKALVAGNLGPIPEQMERHYTEQGKILAECGVDVFLLEGIMSCEQGVQGVKALQAVSDKPIWVSCFSDGKGHLLSGEKLSTCGKTMADLGVAVFGLHCLEIDELVEEIRDIREELQLPLLVQPSGGKPTWEKGQGIYPPPTEKWGKLPQEFWELGVRVFGGCCGTDPRHITQLAQGIAQIKKA